MNRIDSSLSPRTVSIWHPGIEEKHFQMTSLINLNSKVLKKGDPEPAAPAPGQVRVYNMRFCPWAERVILYLSAKHIKAEVVNVHLQEKPEWYFKKHPEGKVPALEIDGEITIESGLIPEYLDDKFPEHRILPTDPHRKFQQKLYVEQLGVLGPAFYGMMAAFKDPSVAEEKNGAVKTAFAKVESLLPGKFFGGEELGYADILAFPFFERHYWVAGLGIGPLDAKNFPGTDYPKLTVYFKNVSEVPEIKATLQPLETVQAFLKTYASGTPDYDAGI